MVEGEGDGVKRDIPVISMGWKALDEALRRNGIIDPQVYWSVTWVKCFKGTAPAVPLGDRSRGDVERYLSALSGNPRFESWQIEQASEALRILYQEVIAAAWAHPWVCVGSPAGNPAVKKRPRSTATPEETLLLLRLRDEIRVRRYSPKTERAYVGWALRFLEFRRGCDPELSVSALLREFLSGLATVHLVSASTQNQALNALIFFLDRAAGTRVGEIGEFPRAKRPRRLPAILSPGEVRRLLDAMSGLCALMAELLYGAGLRLAECASLRVRDLDFENNRITVHEGKGRKDRITLLPLRARSGLLQQLDRVRAMYDRDTAPGFRRGPPP